MIRKTFVLALPLMAVATATLADPGDIYGNGHMWGGGFGVFGGLMMLVFWGAAIALVVFFVRWLNEKDKKKSGSDAQDILKGRFARGEIDEDEFRKRKAALDD
tara:strand:+ start:438 stop:746 length:309 start_codon:yes stop_codon:yes gene_type:complete